MKNIQKQRRNMKEIYTKKGLRKNISKIVAVYNTRKNT